MPAYRVYLPLQGDPLPLRLDGKPFELRHDGRAYELRNPPASARVTGAWAMIEPVEAATADAAYLLAAKALNSGLNVLATRYDHVAAVGLGYLFQNLADPTDHGDRDRVQITPLPFGLRSAFPELLPDDLGCRSPAFYRRALETDDPVDRCRDFCLAIEEAGKRIRAGLTGAKDEGNVIRDTIEEVFKKAGRTARLKELRAAIPDEFLAEQYRGNKGQLHVAMNDFLYQHVRVLVMHAGQTGAGGEPVKDTYAPYDAGDRRRAVRVLDALTEVAGLYARHELDLAEKAAAKAPPKGAGGG